jgi:hypothetical protein
MKSDLLAAAFAEPSGAFAAMAFIALQWKRSSKNAVPRSSGARDALNVGNGGSQQFGPRARFHSHGERAHRKP